MLSTPPETAMPILRWAIVVVVAGVVAVAPAWFCWTRFT